MDRLDIPQFEKDKGRECFAKGNYEEAVKHFSKVYLPKFCKVNYFYRLF